jgi:CRP-like cAMP-binding protein
MMTQQISVLAGQPFPHGTPPAQARELAALCGHVTIPAGQRLFEEGSPAHRFWLVDAGQVTLDARVPGQGRAIIETLGRNDLLGPSRTPPDRATTT